MPEETDDKKYVTFEAPWRDRMRHSSDPNRVGSRQIPSPGEFDQRPLNQLTPAPETDYRSQNHVATDPQATKGEPSYYDVPILQKPVWKWQIATYFYLGGLSAGAYLLGRAAERGGGMRYQKLARAASLVALAAIAPCPGLLIWDLGDPKRFHHMLRVWKPSTPMNFGTWAITAYSGHVALEALRQWLISRGEKTSAKERDMLRRLMRSGALLLIHDAGGAPLAVIVASYTGVLLSCTSNPLWCKNDWLAPLFAASSISTGAEAVSLAMGGGEGAAGQRVLQRIDTLAHIAELLMMKGFMKQAGEKADPLHHGRMKKVHHFSTGAIIAAEVIKHVPVPKHLRKPRRVLSAALGLAGGFALRWAMVFGGHEAAADPHLSRVVSRPAGTSS